MCVTIIMYYTVNWSFTSCNVMQCIVFYCICSLFVPARVVTAAGHSNHCNESLGIDYSTSIVLYCIVLYCIVLYWSMFCCAMS